MKKLEIKKYLLNELEILEDNIDYNVSMRSDRINKKCKLLNFYINNEDNNNEN